MGRRFLLPAFAVGLAAVFVWIAFRTGADGYTHVVLTDGDTGRLLLNAILEDGEEMHLTWRNSLFGLPVREVLHARDGRLIQDEVSFFDPAGPPPAPVGAADVEDLYHTGGAFTARGLARPFSRVVYRVGEIGNPRLEVRDRTISFQAETGFGGRVILAADRPTQGEILRARLFGGL